MTSKDLPAPVSPAAVELVRLKRALTPKQRRALAKLRETGQFWGALDALGYSHHTGHRWMRDPKFVRARELTEQASLDAIGVTDTGILSRLAAVAHVDPRGFYRADGSMKEMHELTAEQAAAIAGMDVTETYEGAGENRKLVSIRRKPRYRDNVRALELLGRHRKLWTEEGQAQTAPTGPGLRILVQQADGTQVGIEANGPLPDGHVMVTLPRPKR